MGGSTPDLEAVLGHVFQAPALLEEALTHPSVEASVNYQRLEFLGDRVLGLVIAAALIRRYPDSPEGELATRYNALVRRETLAKIAGDCSLAEAIRLSRSEIETGGRAKPAILADVLEAVLGALYLDGGLAVAEAFVTRWWQPYIADQKAAPKDAKTGLQEWVQAQGYPTPVYEEVGREGPPHAPKFTMAVKVGQSLSANGSGPSKQAAEQAAAEHLLARLADDSGKGRQS